MNLEFERFVQANKKFLPMGGTGPLLGQVLAAQVAFERLGGKSEVMDFCQKALMLADDETVPMQLTEIRLRDKREHGECADEPAVAYNQNEHGSMLSQWGATGPLGSGLVVPYVASLFVGVIGWTNAALIYGAFTNPAAPAIARAKVLIRLLGQIIETSRAAGITGFMATTSNDVVLRYMQEKLGAEISKEVVLWAR